MLTNDFWNKNRVLLLLKTQRASYRNVNIIIKIVLNKYMYWVWTDQMTLSDHVTPWHAYNLLNFWSLCITTFLYNSIQL